MPADNSTNDRTIYDHSILQPITHCARKWYYQYHERLEPAGGFAPRDAGSAGHKALEVIYRKGFDAVEEAVEVLRAEYTTTPSAGWISYLTPAHLEIIFRNYVDWYSERDPYRSFEVIEEPLVAEAGTLLPFAFGGIPDLIEHGDDPAVIDHKWTVAYFGNKRKEVTYRQQGRLYVALARELLDFDGRRAVFNLISMKEKAAQADFTGQRFERIDFDYQEQELEDALEWAEGAQWMLERQLQDAGDAEWRWPKNSGKHCAYCTYRDVCYAKTDRLRQSALEGFRRDAEPEGLLLSGADG